MKRLLPPNKSFSSLVLGIFSFLYEKDEFKSFEAYSKESVPKTGMPGETIIQLNAVNSGHRLTGLFLKSSLFSVQERNRRRAPRWFEKPFSFKGEQVFLSSQWNSEGEYQLTLDDLNFFLKQCYCNKNEDSYYKVLKNDELFEFNEVKKGETNEDEVANQKKNCCVKIDFSVSQKIFFGAPGTGKSFKVNQLVGDSENVFRTTFHPDYDYAQFVGSYKPVKVNSVDPGDLSKNQLSQLFEKFKDGTTGYPVHKFGALYWKSLQGMSGSDKKAIIAGNQESTNTMDVELNKGAAVGSYLSTQSSEGSITYSFVPQVFANAYAAAWKNLSQPVYLVIEEINRGNCAQIFGDLFQLLDRDENGYSSYEIEADADFADWIEKQLDSSAASQNDIPEEICSGRKLRLPPNFNILATMNTSDQSLFPMDSAFKRRFDWEYVPIDFEGKDCASYQIKIDDENSYPWQKFVESVNEKIFCITDSEDKQLGEYFIKLNPVDNNVITKERFLGKVMFYLWNEVCKDVHKQESFFREEENGNYFTFQDLYKKDGDKKLISFMDWITK